MRNNGFRNLKFSMYASDYEFASRVLICFFENSPRIQYTMDFVENIKQEILEGEAIVKQEKPGDFTLILPPKIEETNWIEEVKQEGNCNSTNRNKI